MKNILLCFTVIFSFGCASKKMAFNPPSNKERILAGGAAVLPGIATGEGLYQCFRTQSSISGPITMGDATTRDNTLNRLNTITAFIQNYCDIENKKGQELLSVQPISITNNNDYQYFIICCVLNDNFRNIL